MSDNPTIGIQLNTTGRDAPGLVNRLRRQRSDNNFPHTARAVQRLTEEAQSVFLRAIQGKPVSYSGGSFTVNRISGALHGAVLGGLRYPHRGNPLRGAVLVNHFHWKLVKGGVRMHDMKPRLLASSKAKIGKDGRRYLVVPIPVDPKKPFGARVLRVVKEGSRGWVYGASAFRSAPYNALTPRRVDLYVKEEMQRKNPQAQLRAAMARDLRGEA